MYIRWKNTSKAQQEQESKNSNKLEKLINLVADIQSNKVR